MQPLRSRILITAAMVAISLPAFSEETKSAPTTTEEVDIHTVRGNPPADHPFAKITLGMAFDQALQVLGKPTAERSYCTGKHRIPFYYGRDRAYTEYFYQGQGKIYFYSRFSSVSAFHGAINTCSPTEPFEVAGVEYNINETGVAPLNPK